MKYRPEVDGLRAVAIVPVILYHAGIGLFRGGFLGVDVFFVLSGYLITTVLVTEVEQGRFSLTDFYVRRARRILPALFLTLSLTALAAPFFLIPSQIKDVAQSIVATSLFLSNYFFYRETDYFNPFTQDAPLLHTWSLAVEEQFYFAYPWVVLLLARRGRKPAIAVTAAILLASLVAAQRTGATDRSFAFYLIHTRAWELMVGSLLALVGPRLARELAARGVPRRPWLLEAVNVAALGTILLSMSLFTRDTPHPSLLTAIPVLATALLLFFTGYPTRVTRLLASRIPVEIGLISYGLYLYHNPVFSYIALAHEATPERVRTLQLISVPLIFGFAAASYHLLEQPIRRSKALTPRVVFPVALACIGLFTAAGYEVHRENGFQDYFVRRFAARGGVVLVDVEAERAAVDAFHARFDPADTPYTCGSSCTKVLVVGDSFAKDVYYSLQALGPRPFEVRLLPLDDECLADAMGQLFEADAMSCDGTEARLGLIPQADIVVLAEGWQEETYERGFEFARAIADHGPAKVFVSGSITFASLSSMSLKLARDGVTPAESAHVMFRYVRWDRTRTSDALRGLVATDERLHWIEKRDFFCDFAREACSLFDEAGLPRIWDHAHLTERNYVPFGRFVEARLFPTQASSSR